MLKSSLTLCLLLSVLTTLASAATSNVDFDSIERLKEGENVSDDTLIYGMILPHSHQDVGWLKTIDDYYWQSVKPAYDSVVAEIGQNPNRRFISVEMAFFSRWWGDASSEQRDLASAAIKSGQFEFINGGWCMHDAAVTHYDADILQMSLGHDFIKNTFGCDAMPKIAWHIDPFGESAVDPTLFALMGFNGFIISRIDYVLRAQMEEDKKLQFVWRGSKNYGKDAQCFTYDLDHYSYCTAHHEHLQFDDYGVPPVTEENIESLADMLATNIRERSSYFSTPYVLFPFGCDFEWVNATAMYYNMDKLIDYINTHVDKWNVKVQYVTLGEYLKTIHNQNKTWTVRNDEDFFPYDDNYDAYWTGFYTSRSRQKGYTRSRDGVSRTAEQLFAMGRVHGQFDRKGYFDRVTLLRQAMGDAQHHDGITGTERPDVVQDYISRMSAGTDAVGPVMSDCASWLTQKPGSHAIPDLTVDDIAVQSMGKGDDIPIVVTNTLAWDVDSWIRLNVSSENIVVHDALGIFVPSQTNKRVLPGADPVYEIFIQVSLPPLGFSTYFLSIDDSSEIGRPTDDTSIQNDAYIIETDANTGFITDVTVKSTGDKVKLGQELLQYYSYAEYGDQNSGAYIFRPNDTKPHAFASNPKFQVITGPYVSEIRQFLSDQGIVVVRLYNGTDGQYDLTNLIEIEHIIGPLDEGQEVITRFSTSLDSNDVFYTDNNGLEMRKRTRRSVKQFPVTSNYYPLVSMGYIEDVKRDLAMVVLTDRSHGVSSLASGQLEIMLHRRTILDDGRGLGMSLNDLDVVLPTLRLFIGSSKQATRMRHRGEILTHFPPAVLFSAEPVARQGYVDSFITTHTALHQPLPENVHLLSLMPLDAESETVVLRMVNIFEVDEDSELSRRSSVDLSSMFAQFSVANIEERSLNHVWALKDVKRWEWKTESDVVAETPIDVVDDDDTVITLDPIQIRTFYLDLKA